MIKVEGYPNLFRDPNSGAIINCDDHEYNQYLKSLDFRKKQKEELQNMKKDIDEIKSLLKILVEGNNKP
tara:strand:+ start:520 stop:726 length:207 start_codon:yes stop_codon:yes gene_type:complete